MIKATQKDLQEIIKMVEGSKKLLVAGCGTCVSVCFAGGEKEVGLMTSELKMALSMAGKKVDIEQVVMQRQCEKEFIEEVEDKIEDRDSVLSLACGVGVQVLVKQYPAINIYPGLNTQFMGPPKEQGLWYENCAGCGDCVLHLTGGICPVARCAKNLLNGPCGGSQDGKCEVSKDTECGWNLIIERLKAKGKLDDLAKIWQVKDWRPSAHGGPRQIVREDLLLKKEDE